MNADLILPPCRVCHGEKYLTRYEANQRIDFACHHCKGSGVEPPLSEQELEARGQTTLLVEARG